MARDNFYTPKDQLLADLFSGIDVAESFLATHLPPEILDKIDIKSLRPKNDEFTAFEMEENHSGSLYGVQMNGQEAFIYFVYENNPPVGENLGAHVFRYMAHIWKEASKNSCSRLPLIIPVVITCGNQPGWDHIGLGDTVQSLPDRIRKYAKYLRILIVDLGDLDAWKLKAKENIRFVDVQGNTDGFRKSMPPQDFFIWNGEQLLQSLQSQAKDDAGDYFRSLLEYLFQVGAPMTPEELEAIIQELKGVYEKGSEIMKSTVDMLREEGIQLGRQEGIQLGEAKALVRITLRLLRKKFGPLPNDIEEKVARMKPGDLEIMIDEVLDYKSIEDAKKWLH